MYPIKITDFEQFMHKTARAIIDSNNDIDVLNKALFDYNEMKAKVDPDEILNMSGDFINFDKRFEKVLDLGFKRVEERNNPNSLSNKVPF